MQQYKKYNLKHKEASKMLQAKNSLRKKFKKNKSIIKTTYRRNKHHINLTISTIIIICGIAIEITRLIKLFAINNLGLTTLTTIIELILAIIVTALGKLTYVVNKLIAPSPDLASAALVSTIIPILIALLAILDEDQTIKTI